jgi:hypothetical protein
LHATRFLVTFFPASVNPKGSRTLPEDLGNCLSKRVISDKRIFSDF